MTHPHHICHLTVDGNGWIVPAQPSSSAAAATKDDNASSSPSSPINGIFVPLTTKCRQLLTELRFVNLSNEIFSGKSCQSCPTKEDVDIATLEELPCNPSDKLSDLLRSVIADVRRMGGPSSRDAHRNNATNNNDNDEAKEDENGEVKVVKSKKKRGRRRNGQVVRLEEQRRLRQEQEAQKEKINSSVLTTEEDNVDDSNDVDDGGDDDDDSDDETKQDKDQVDGEDNKNGNNTELNSDIQLASTFNTLRVLITILRPILDHPHHNNDDTLKMKHAPNKKKLGYYMISTHVCSPVSKGEWNDTRLSFVRMLNEVEPGLFRKVMKRVNGDTEYEFNVKEWTVGLFNHDQLSSKEYVAKQSIGEDLLEACKDSNQIIHKFNNVLLDRFQNDGDEKKQRKLQESIRNLQNKLSKAISRNFPDVRLTVYGSCLSGLALEGSHDVDVSVYIPELDHLKQDFDAGVISASEYERKMKRVLFRIKGSLQKSESFVEVFAIAHARVPVVKGVDVRAKNPYEEDGSLAFDLCFLNDIAVVNSSLLREYSLFDNRVRILMLSIKSFAKLNKIASAANGTLSSYSWLNLVVFYLQCIGFLPTLQCPKLMEDHGFQPDPSGNRWHSINGLETFYLTEKIVSQGQVWEQSPLCSDVNLPVLLYGFFNFYTNVFPQQTVAASIRLGEMSLQKTSFKGSSKLWRMCIEDCFETYYSHCPHDLGCHLKERGQEQMYDHFDQMTNDLEYLLKQENVNDKLVDTFIGMFCSGTGSKPKKQPTKSSFKGKCDNCHQVGHKRVDCPLKGKREQDGGNSSFKGRCNNCQQIGHKRVDCPQLRNNMNGHASNSSGGSHQKHKGGRGRGGKPSQKQLKQEKRSQN
mmetsp:Transcript_32510/g.66206  ORF Transcript_32510/g.66206 Transcript_32510/m.66206 type:complete len:862 (+) Transcript_32510:78-2663(+)